jgi:predicted dehydrogenase
VTGRVIRVLVVGLGTIARTHLAVLDRRPDVDVVGGVDPGRPEAPFPVFGALDEALAAGEPDLVVVATPTDTHVDLVDELLTRTGALVLSEKPLARTGAALAGLEARHSPAVLGERVKVAHHFAFSPEVEWARSYVAARPGLGAPTQVQAVFNDAYTELPAAQRASLVSSWVDSAPNQLSIVSAFVDGLRLDSHSALVERAVTTLVHDGGRTFLSSNWLAADSSKQTTLDYGEVRLWLDHTSMTAVATEDARVVEHVAYTGAASRKDAHYLGLYDALLHRPDDPRLGVRLAASITALIDEAERSPDAGPVWSEVTA